MVYLIIAYILSVVLFAQGIVFIITKRKPFTTSEGPPSFHTSGWYSVHGFWAKCIGVIWLIPLPVLVACHLLIPGELLAAAGWAICAGVCIVASKGIQCIAGRQRRKEDSSASESNQRLNPK